MVKAPARGIIKRSRKICMVKFGWFVNAVCCCGRGVPGVWEEMWLLDILEVYDESTNKGHHKKDCLMVHIERLLNLLGYCWAQKVMQRLELHC
jgi:hypothetical protein